MKLEEIFQGKRVLITGHTGFKGAWLGLTLQQLGAQIAGFADNVPSQPSLFEALNLGSTLIDYRGDIRSYAPVAAALQKFKPEIIFHLAAQSLVRPSYDFAKETFDINAGGTVNILEAVRQCLPAASAVQAVVVVTSDKCYDAENQDGAFKEEHALGGNDPYSASKACAELIFKSYARSFFKEGGPALGSARAGNVIGGGDWAQDRLVPDCIRHWAAGQTVKIRNPDVHRPWQSIFDVTRGYLLLAAALLTQNQKVRGESFNFGPTESDYFSVSEIVSKLSSYWQPSAWHVEGNLTHKIEGASFRLDSSKAHRELNWRPRVNTDMSLKITAEWYRNFYVGRINARDFSAGQIRDYLQHT